jgi:predicted ATPase
VRALLADLAGAETGPERFSRWLHSRSGGNPFFALETLKASSRTAP